MGWAAPQTRGLFLCFGSPELDVPVEVLAAVQADQTYFLVKEGDGMDWLPSSRIYT